MAKLGCRKSMDKSLQYVVVTVVFIVTFLAGFYSQRIPGFKSLPMRDQASLAMLLIGVVLPLLLILVGIVLLGVSGRVSYTDDEQSEIVGKLKLAILWIGLFCILAGITILTLELWRG